MMMNKPELTQERINEIQKLINENQWMGRTEISKQICYLWEWRSPNGQIKDIACRDMLRALDKTGKICLPPPKLAIRQPGQRGKCKHLKHNQFPIECELEELLPVQLEIVNVGATLNEFKSYIAQFHYLGFDRVIGESIRYLARDCRGIPIACLLFGSAAWSCTDRDHFIGWDKRQKTANLMRMTNNTRFLVFPWVRVFNLSSHILALVSKRINRDWNEKYGHDIVCLETFVDERFLGTCYRAANWIYVGRTSGRGRDGGHHNAILPIKHIYLYPLNKNYRELLRNEPP